MTANQIIIPIILLASAMLLLWVLRSMKQQRDAQQRQTHQPHNPTVQNTSADVAHSIAQGQAMGGGDSS